MKKLLLSILLLNSLLSFSQKVESNVERNIVVEKPTFLSIEATITSPESLINILADELHLSDDDGLKLLHNIPSPAGNHYTFIHTFKGYEVYQALIKVNTDKKGNVISCLSAYHSITDYDSKNLTPRNLEKKNKEITDHILTSQLTWLPINSRYELGMRYTCAGPNGEFYENIYNFEDKVIETLDLLQHITDVDTTAKALVFSPNPVTSAETIYGGNYIDNNDNTNSYLDSERDTVDIEVSYENGAFILQNQYVKLVESSLPNIPPVTSNTPFFYYDRSESGFEDVNVLHHVTQIQKYIQQLGFTNIVDYQIEIDCHGFNGADNSAFSSGTNPPSIVFGEGGVDDAEDADVIIHEYTHAIMESASPNTNFGTERGAMDEAFGDYMAVSYSLLYLSYHSDYVFKWDGHNEYWDGRLTTSSAMYPNDLQFNLYLDAPMWSSALTRIERNIGRDKTVTLALEAAYGFTSNMTMAQAAQLFIQTDNLINNGDNYATLCWIFKDKGMVNSCSVGRPGNLLGTEDPTNASNIRVVNSLEFAQGKENLRIDVNDKYDLYLYDVSGRLIWSVKDQIKSTEISPEQLQKNVYIIKIVTPSETKSIKVLLAQ